MPRGRRTWCWCTSAKARAGATLVCATVEAAPSSSDRRERSTPAKVDRAFWRGRSVLLTGHTGFKGAWLSLWLQSLGAEVRGISLGESPSEPSLYDLARVEEEMAASVVCDIRDADALAAKILAAAPEIVIHMAAQPLVRRSYASPRETYETNAMGTANVLEAVRLCDRVRAVLVVTSDKCYENMESGNGYREEDKLGGHDPYSSSKAAAELITSAYRRSFFSGDDAPRVATARAGNVIGGGDWGEDRLIPDVVRAVQSGELLRLRNPGAIRPWQHVLCPLYGYLLLAEALCESPDYARAWNFGPAQEDARSVEWLVRQVSDRWPGGVQWELDGYEHPHEARLLELDSSQAREHLGWAPPLALEAGVQATVEWYLAWREAQDVRELTLAQMAAHVAA
jgi:CDP-glucose 4,6-dehydratase